MPVFFKLLGMSGISLVVCAVFGMTDCFAVGRAAYENVRSTSIGASRMPTMPTLPLNTLGNISENIPSNNISVPVLPQGKPDVPEKPDDVPGDKPDDKPDDKPNVPDVPVPECPDGGVKNSEYTVNMCMNDILRCINNGGLPNGLNSLFNEDLRNAIMNGMGVCAVQVDKCVSDVRRDCSNVYRSAADVWIDFDSRKVQPEYYSFVLRKTGLTPNQAENTCLLLDRNTYGASFNAVANNGGTTAEYNKNVGAYNGQNGGVLIKKMPRGETVNTGHSGVDGQRGHYARWDAETATCFVRVAAYNKDKHITNSWLFGAMGDDQPAEVWRAAGETFTCNKDLFGFSLMNDTHTAAVVGIGGGTLVGAGVGAIAGHGKREFDCTRDSHLKQLTEELSSGHKIGVLNQYLDLDNHLSTTGGTITTAQCQDILNLYNVYVEYETAVSECEGMEYSTEEVTLRVKVKIKDDRIVEVPVTDGKVDEAELNNILKRLNLKPEEIAEVATMVRDSVAEKLAALNGGTCRFRPLNLAKMAGTGIFCSSQTGCLEPAEIRRDLTTLGDIFDDLSILKGEKSNMGQSIAIGAAVGAGTGGLATAITAYVERSNINCRVGDGLSQVGFGKAHSIDSLRDFYVKWNLVLPDVIAPTATIVDCQSWKNTCATYLDMNQCRAAQFNYKPADASTTTLIHSVCAVSGSICVENYPVAKSYGACK